jgi:hypothetical protein
MFPVQGDSHNLRSDLCNGGGSCPPFWEIAKRADHRDYCLQQAPGYEAGQAARQPQ